MLSLGPLLVFVLAVSATFTESDPEAPSAGVEDQYALLHKELSIMCLRVTVSGKDGHRLGLRLEDIFSPRPRLLYIFRRVTTPALNS